MNKEIENLYKCIITVMIICALLLTMNIMLLIKINHMRGDIITLQDQLDVCKAQMKSYEKRTSDVFTQWDSMRKSQLTILEILDASGRF